MTTNPNDPIHCEETRQILYPSDLPREVVDKLKSIPIKSSGLSKREEFAKAAMTGLLSNAVTISSLSLATKDPERGMKIIAEMASLAADALIAQLNKAEK